MDMPSVEVEAPPMEVEVGVDAASVDMPSVEVEAPSMDMPSVEVEAVSMEVEVRVEAPSMEAVVEDAEGPVLFLRVTLAGDLAQYQGSSDAVLGDLSLVTQPLPPTFVLHPCIPVTDPTAHPLAPIPLNPPWG